MRRPCRRHPPRRVGRRRSRAALVAACRQLRVPLVEDDPYGTLDHNGNVHTTCLSMDSANVLYLGSFSKILSPGIRLGYVVAPLPVARRLELAKQASDLHSSSLLQRVVFEIVKDGFLTRHIATCQALYRANAQVMEGALRHHLHGLAEWQAPTGGMFLWLELAAGLDATKLLDHAIEAGVAYVPGAPFYADHAQANTARLCFSTGTPQEMEQGVARLARVLRGQGGAT